jgi:hypothetical protein
MVRRSAIITTNICFRSFKYRFATILTKDAEMTSPNYDDWLAIVGALNKYCHYFDTREFDRLAEVVLPDATCYGQSGLEEAIERVVRPALGGCGPTQHLLGNYEISVEGDRATSRTNIRAFHLGAGSKYPLTYEAIGVYNDQWTRTSEGWRIREHVFDVACQIGDNSVLQPPG